MIFQLSNSGFSICKCLLLFYSFIIISIVCQSPNILFNDLLDLNTWITTLFISCSKPVNKVKAVSQWQALRETFNNLGLETDICPAAPGILSFGHFPSDKNYLNSRLLTVKYICTKISITF